MILKLLSFILLISFALRAGAQSVCALSDQRVNIEDCFSRVPDYRDELNANFVVKQVLQKAGLSNTNFVVKTCDGLNNAIATKIAGLNYIILDLKWMQSLKSGNSDWFHLAVIGHEVGHHLLGHTNHITESLAQSRNQELEADEFAGYILGSYGIPDAEVNALLGKLSSGSETNSSHPQNAIRLGAYWKGIRVARLKESTAWLRNVTSNTKLDLSNVPQLISLARENFYIYLNTADPDKLAKASELYKQAVRFDETEQTVYELGWAFFINQDYSKYVKGLNHLYNKTHKITYLFELAGYFSSSKDLETSQFLSSHSAELHDVSLLRGMPAQVVVNYAKYRFATMNGAVSDTGDVKIIRETLLNVISNLKSQSSINQEYTTLAEAQNELGCIYLRLEQYKDAQIAFKESAASFDARSPRANINEEIYRLSSVNQIINLSNLCLTHIRLSNWTAAAYYCAELRAKYDQASSEAKRKVDRQFIRADMHYYEGRIAHNTKDYERAVMCYGSAIAQDDKPYLRFYRGLSLLALSRRPESCSDFKKACEGGVLDACNRMQLLCK